MPVVHNAIESVASRKEVAIKITRAETIKHYADELLKQLMPVKKFENTLPTFQRSYN